MKNTYVNFTLLHIVVFLIIWQTGFYLAFIPFSITFILSLFKDYKNRTQKYKQEAAKKIAKLEQDRKTNEWKTWKDDGAEFINQDHQYSSDLDIFGRASIFQKFNEAKTYFGRLYVKELLTEPNSEILKRQEAVKELSENKELITKLKIELSLNREISENPEELIQLFKTNEKVLKNPLIKILAVLVPTILIGSIFLGWFEVFIVAFFANIALFLALFVFVNKTVSPLYRFKKAMGNIKNIISLIAETEFEAHLNKEAKAALIDGEALKNINKINFLAEAINVRHNFILYLILNLGLLWDVNLATYLEELRGKIDIEKWLKQVAHFEAMLTLANVAQFEDTSYPKLINENKITAELLTHPLIEKPISNSIKLDGIAIVSGSNMSGKTTFLRTIGTNLVLFYAGAPVFAKSFEAPKLSILTSMRITDNLEENISTFYAELIRIEKIIKKRKENVPMLFLIDEIFRGTNSEDRIAGAKKVLEQLFGSLGLITTHDLEVSNNFQGKQGFTNFHFKEDYLGNKISFDYKMREGISTTRNAIYLMKMVGIE
ncbi:MAG: hypothetical protein FWF50_05720 [Defluviitaleaceae bacterium]|nr:hypothetical protein [Defluviitaleaceae bacterium]